MVEQQKPSVQRSRHFPVLPIGLDLCNQSPSHTVWGCLSAQCHRKSTGLSAGEVSKQTELRRKNSGRRETGETGASGRAADEMNTVQDFPTPGFRGLVP